MRVMCIDDKWTERFRAYRPSIGEIVTATQSDYRVDCYRILEYPIDPDGCRLHLFKWHFAPLSDIDETELVNQREQPQCA